MSPTPRVSIPMPVWNATATIREAIESALEQTFEDFELVVCDNASTDETVEVVRSYRDPRIRVHRSPVNVGYQRNMNWSISLCRGPLIKFLHGDDRLHPACVERMAGVMDLSERVGMVFCRRRIEIPADAGSDYEAFRAQYEDAYRNFGELRTVNDGRAMLARWLRTGGLRDNWVGEPSITMMRRSALERLGLFNPRMRMTDDQDMWARTMAYYDIGFVDEELAMYRSHPANLTASQTVSARWADRLWMLEGLRADPALDAEFPELRKATRTEWRRVAKRVVRDARRDPSCLAPRAKVLGEYAGYLARRAAGRGTALHPPLGST